MRINIELLRSKLTGYQNIAMRIYFKAVTPECFYRGSSSSLAWISAEGSRYRAGPHALDFLAPRDAASPLAEWMRRFGPSPYAAVLKGAGTVPIPLNPALTHGANLFVK